MRLKHLFAALTLFAATLGLSTLVVLGATVRELDRLAMEQRQAGDIARHVSALLQLSHEYILHREPRAQQQWQTRFQRLKALLEEARPADPAHRQMRADVLDSVSALPGLYDGLVTSFQAESSDPLASRRREFLIDRLLTETQSIAETAFEWDSEAAVAEARLERKLTVLAIACPALLALLFAAAAQTLARRVTSSLRVLQENVAAVAQGDLTARNHSHAPDELGDLSRGFDHMAEELQSRDRALKSSESFLRSVTDNLPLEIAYLDTLLRYRFMNRRHVERHAGLHQAGVGETLEEATGMLMTRSFEDEMERALAGELRNFEEESTDSAGQVCIVETTLVPDADANGIARGVFLLAIDVTDRRRQQAHIEQALKEKEVLLREIHHRVKNNLQVISSLLQLQTRHLKDGAAREALSESQNRIRSMALIHEKLYQSRDFASVDFADYLRSLVAMQHSFQGELAARVSVSVEAEATSVEIDRAVPAGLLLNELLSNSFKHAFPGDRRGRVDIRLRACASRVVLSVSDDGIGVDAEFDPLPHTSLGLQLVHTLARQLDGALSFQFTKGFACSVHFPRQASPRLPL